MESLINSTFFFFIEKNLCIQSTNPVSAGSQLYCAQTCKAQIARLRLDFLARCCDVRQAYKKRSKHEITSVTFGQSVLCESLAVKFGLIRAEFVYMPNRLLLDRGYS